jgi:hypothetical protein
MSALVKAAMGTLLVKSALALPQTATATLFTVANGAVIVNGLIGRITTAAGGTATTLSLGTTAGGVASLATATAITSKAAGTWLTPIAAAEVAGALQVIGPSSMYVGGTNFPNPPEWPAGPLAPFFQAPDNITWTTSANDAGNITWYLWYVPLDAGVVVS